MNTGIIVEETADEKANQRSEQRRGALFPWVDANTRVVPPDLTFAERMTITLGDRRLTLLYAGPAHCSSDTMMMVEPDGVLFAGDIVQNGRIPFMNSDDVSTTQWLRALDEVAKLEPKFIIPGHGRTSDRGQAGDRLHPGLHPIFARARWRQGGAGLDRFRCRLQRRPTGRNTRTCRPSPTTTAAMPTGFIWNWSNRSSKPTSRDLPGVGVYDMAEYVVEFGKDGKPVEPDGRLDAAAFHRNHEAIWAVLAAASCAATAAMCLEAGSGTGQHVVTFARNSPGHSVVAERFQRGAS